MTFDIFGMLVRWAVSSSNVKVISQSSWSQEEMCILGYNTYTRYEVTYAF